MAQVATCDGCTSAKEKIALLYVCVHPPSISHMPVQVSLTTGASSLWFTGLNVLTTNTALFSLLFRY